MTYLGLSINWSIDLVHVSINIFKYTVFKNIYTEYIYILQGNLHTNEANAKAIGVGKFFYIFFMN